MDFDFAILKLKTLIPFSEYVNAVCLLSINSEIDFNQENNLVVSGWGNTSPTTEDTGISIFASWLQYTRLTGYTNAKCCDLMYGFNGSSCEITENMICAGIIEGGIDSCQGDSGGKILNFLCICTFNIFFLISLNTSFWIFKPILISGPLTYENKTNGKTNLVGVVSWGFGCALENKLGVYARVSQVTAWILKNSDIYTNNCYKNNS